MASGETPATTSLNKISPSNASSTMSSHNFAWSTYTASDVASGLLERFDGDQTRTLDFLAACQQAVRDAASLSNDSTTAAAAPSAVDWGESLLQEPITLSMMSPRGKVLVQFSTKGMRAWDAKNPTVEAWHVTADQVSHVVLFPKPEDCKKDLSKKSPDMVLLHLKESLTVRNLKKPVSQISFALPANLPALNPTTSAVDTPNNDGDEPVPNAVTHAWRDFVLRPTLATAQFLRVLHPQAAESPTTTAARAAFASYQADGVSTTSAGLPFVGCYHGTRDGVLYPLADGSLLFHKPPLLVPANTLDGITTGGRGGGAGGTSSRYVDLHVQCVNGETLEFTNINSEEVQGLQKFLALAQASTNHGATSASVNDGDGRTEDEEDERASSGDRPRSKRKASAEARRINKRMVVSIPTAPAGDMEDEDDEEEDDIDYVAAEVDEDSDSDETESDDDNQECDEEEESTHDAEAGHGNETEEETESEG